jgi:hypothetical protein
MAAMAAMILPVARAEDAVIRVVEKPDVMQKRNEHYASNRDPLLPSPLTCLPFGAIKPRGWLRKQLELQAAGFVGHLTEISGFCRKEGNAWLSPDGQGGQNWEEVPYWFRGFAAMGYVLDDERVIKEAQPWIEAAIASQTDFGYFGPNANLMAPIHPAVPPECFATADGKPGLDAEYFSDQQFKTSAGKRVDAQLDFRWPKKSPPMDGLKGEHYSVRWTGKLTVKTAGDYRFSLYCDDGAKLFIDGKVIVDDFSGHGPRTTTAPEPLHLEAGKAYDLKVDFFQDINDAEIRLGWKIPGAAYECRDAIPELMPNMNMLYALRTYHEYTGDKRVLDWMTRYFRWEMQIPDKKFYSGGWQVPRNGDNIDSVYWLYNRTGEAFLLELAAKLQRCGSSWLNTVKGGHNVDFSQGYRKPALFYQQNKDPKFLKASEDNWDSIMGIYGQVPGGMFGGDEFARPNFTDPRQAIETCGIVEMMHSEQIMFRITGENKWADRYEDAVFNSLPAALTADLKALRYLTSANQTNSDKRSKAPELADGGPMQWMNPYEHRCCQHNCGMGWPYFAQGLWQATPGNGLAAVNYCASEVKATVGSSTEVTIAQETRYPFDGQVELTLNPAAAVRFPLYLRIPAWCAKPEVALNGQRLAVEGSGAFILIERTWAKGDKLTLNLPMNLSVRTWEANKNSVSVNYGPLTFSVKIGENYVKSGGTEKWPAWEILATTPWNYGLVLDPKKPDATIEVVNRDFPADHMPFTHAGTPIELKAKARKLPNWKEDHLGLVDKLQPSPVKSSEPEETIVMVPMGAARIRLAALPVIGTGPDASEWKLPPEPMASYSRGDCDFIESAFDGKVPTTSFDPRTPRFTTYSFGGAEHGKLHWIQKNLEGEQTVSSCEVYWFDESSVKGDVRLPKWWKVLYKSGGEWKEVEQPSGYGIEPDKFNVVTFKPVKTTALRLSVQCQDEKGRWAMGLYEWRIK